MQTITETLTEPGTGRIFVVSGACLITVTEVTGINANWPDRFYLVAELYTAPPDAKDGWLQLSKVGATNWGRPSERRSWVDLGPGHGNLPDHSLLRVRLTLPVGQEDIESLTYTVLMDDPVEERE